MKLVFITLSNTNKQLHKSKGVLLGPMMRMCHEPSIVIALVLYKIKSLP